MPFQLSQQNGLFPSSYMHPTKRQKAFSHYLTCSVSAKHDILLDLFTTRRDFDAGEKHVYLCERGTSEDLQ